MTNDECCWWLNTITCNRDWSADHMAISRLLRIRISDHTYVKNNSDPSQTKSMSESERWRGATEKSIACQGLTEAEGYGNWVEFEVEDGTEADIETWRLHTSSAQLDVDMLKLVDVFVFVLCTYIYIYAVSFASVAVAVVAVFLVKLPPNAVR